MERTDRAAVVPLDAGWSDVGSWPALCEAGAQDTEGNVTQGDVLLEEVRNTLVDAEKQLVACLGVDDLIIVATPDAVLVAHRDRVQEVRRLVDRLKAPGRPEPDLHWEVYRPWGSFAAIDTGYRYKVKRITVKPGARLSCQLHNSRAEHWVVVRGIAEVTDGEHSYLVTENESTYIPIGQEHCLENPGTILLDMIEVQSGSYLGEADIVRIEDTYGRS